VASSQPAGREQGGAGPFCPAGMDKTNPINRDNKRLQFPNEITQIAWPGPSNKRVLSTPRRFPLQSQQSFPNNRNPASSIQQPASALCSQTLSDSRSPWSP